MSSGRGVSPDSVGDNKTESCGEGGESIRRRTRQDGGTMWGETLLKAAVADLDGSDSELSDMEQFLAKGAFLLTPSHELTIEKASTICEKMSFKGQFSLTKTATGILFKFSEPEDYQAVYKKGFHKVTNARFYKKIPIPCRPQKTFSVLVLEVPEDVPEEDVRHALYRFTSVVEVARLPRDTPAPPVPPPASGQEKAQTSAVPPPPVRVTLASLDECSLLLQHGLDFYGATFFPTEPASGLRAGRRSLSGNSAKILDVVATSGQRVRDLLPVFDAAGFTKIPPPTTKTIKPRSS